MKKFKRLLSEKSESMLQASREVKPQKIQEIFIYAFHLCGQALKNIFWIILIFVFFKNINLYLDTFISNSLLKKIISVIQIMAIVYLGVVILLVVNACLERKPVNYRLFFLVAFKRLFSVYIVCLLLGLFLAIMSYITMILLNLAGISSPNVAFYIRLFSFLFIGFCIIFVLLRYFFAMPLIVLDKMKLMAAFKLSGHLVLDNYIRLLSVYAIFIFTIFVCSQQTRHAAILQTYHVSYLFDYVLLCFLLPFSFNLVLLLLRDLKLRYEETKKYLNLP